MKKRYIALLVLGMSVQILTGCQKELTEDAEDVNVEVAIETLDDIEEDNTVYADNNVYTEENTIRVVTVGSPALDILNKSKEYLVKRGYKLEVIVADDYMKGNDMVSAAEADACLYEHEGFLYSYNKSHGTELAIEERLFYEPMGIYSGTVTDINHIPEGITVGVREGDIYVARALYLLEQKGLLELKEDSGFMANLDDVVENPLNINIEECAFETADSGKKYGLYIVDINRAMALGIDNSTLVGKENRNSGIIDYYATCLVCQKDNTDSIKLKYLSEALNSDVVEKFIEKEYDGSVVDYK